MTHSEEYAGRQSFQGALSLFEIAVTTFGDIKDRLPRGSLLATSVSLTSCHHHEILLKGFADKGPLSCTEQCGHKEVHTLCFGCYIERHQDVALWDGSDA